MGQGAVSGLLRVWALWCSLALECICETGYGAKGSEVLSHAQAHSNTVA